MIERRMKGKTNEDEHNIAYNNSNLNHKEFSPLVWMLLSLRVVLIMETAHVCTT